MKPWKSLACALGILTLFACSSAPSQQENPAQPDWTREPARTVDQGYIVYVASDEDPSPERARYKSEAQAIEDLANECTFVPKGARIEDHFDQAIGYLHQSFVKLAVDFQSCDEARNTIRPADIQKLANVAMTGEMKRYQDEIEKPVLAQTPEGDALSNDANPMLNQTQAPEIVAIRSGPQFFVMRQQIAYAKEVVILSPPQAFPPGAAQTTAFENGIKVRSSRVSSYERENPEVRSSVGTWSGYRRQLQQERVLRSGRKERLGRAGRGPRRDGGRRRRKRVLPAT